MSAFKQIEIGKTYIDTRLEGVIKFIHEMPNGMLLGYHQISKDGICNPIHQAKGSLPNTWIEYREPRTLKMFLPIYDDGGKLYPVIPYFFRSAVPDTYCGHDLIDVIEIDWREDK